MLRFCGILFSKCSTLVGGEAPMLNVVIDETYTPYVKSEAGVEREVSNLQAESARFWLLLTA